MTTSLARGAGATAFIALTLTACGGSAAQDGWNGCKAHEIAAQMANPETFTGPAGMKSTDFPAFEEVTVTTNDTTSVIQYEAVVLGARFICLAEPSKDFYNTQWR